MGRFNGTLFFLIAGLTVFAALLPEHAAGAEDTGAAVSLTNFALPEYRK